MEKEQYMLLDRGVEEGRYLSKNKQEEIPSLPKGANEEEEKFYKECKHVMETCKIKMQSYEQKAKAAIEAAKAKDIADMANVLTTDFNKNLEEEYQLYKVTSEEKIKKLREDLAEAKDISSNALNRCDEYNNQIIQLQGEIKKLEKTIEEKEEQIAYYEADFPNGYVLEINGKVAGLLEKRDEGELNLLLQEKEEEIENLKETLEKSENGAKVKVATVMVESGVAYLSNIKKVTKNEEVSFGEKLLKHMVSDNCISHIGQQAVDKLRNKISYITDQREKAEEELEVLSVAEKEADKQKANEQEQARQKLEQDRNQVIKESVEALNKAASKPTIVHNDIKQLATGDGTLYEGVIPTTGIPLPPSSPQNNGCITNKMV